MTPLDWLALSLGLITIVGLQISPKNRNAEMNRTTPGQVASGRISSTATVTMGGRPLWRLAGSGVQTGLERAMVARQNLQAAIAQDDLLHHFFPVGLRLGDGGDFVTVNYFDLRLVSATVADERLNGAKSVADLALQWKATLDRGLRMLPDPLPDAWLAVEPGLGGAITMVADDTLERTAAALLPDGGVSVEAAGGVLILSGAVNSDHERKRLVHLAGQIPGAMGVEDRLTVQP